MSLPKGPPVNVSKVLAEHKMKVDSGIVVQGPAHKTSAEIQKSFTDAINRLRNPNKRKGWSLVRDGDIVWGVVVSQRDRFVIVCPLPTLGIRFDW